MGEDIRVSSFLFSVSFPHDVNKNTEQRISGRIICFMNLNYRLTAAAACPRPIQRDQLSSATAVSVLGVLIGRFPHVFPAVDHPAVAHRSPGSVVADFGPQVSLVATPTPNPTVSIVDVDEKLISAVDVPGVVVSIVTLPDAVGFPGSVIVYFSISNPTEGFIHAP